jgi:hypothetical protein
MKLIPFDTWDDVLVHVKLGLPVWYHAPLDVRPVRVQATARPKGRTVRVTPPTRDDDPFTADAGHFDRFRRDGSPVCPRCLGIEPGTPGGTPELGHPGPFTDRLCQPCDDDNRAKLAAEGR